VKYPRFLFKLADNTETLTLEEERLVNLRANCGLLTNRVYGDLKGRGLCLSSVYDWAIVRDNQGLLCLIAWRKENGKI